MSEENNGQTCKKNCGQIIKTYSEEQGKDYKNIFRKTGKNRPEISWSHGKAENPHGILTTWIVFFLSTCWRIFTCF